jgi:hypothetical protein
VSITGAAGNPVLSPIIHRGCMSWHCSFGQCFMHLCMLSFSYCCSVTLAAMRMGHAGCASVQVEVPKHYFLLFLNVGMVVCKLKSCLAVAQDVLTLLSWCHTNFFLFSSLLFSSLDLPFFLDRVRPASYRWKPCAILAADQPPPKHWICALV